MPDQRTSQNRRNNWRSKPYDLQRYWDGRGRWSTKVARFIGERCLVPSGRGYGKPYHLHPYQRELIKSLVDADPDILSVIWSMPRGAGKTGLVAALAVSALYATPGADIVIASTGMRTARLPFDRAVRIIEEDSELLSHAILHRNPANPYVELPDRGAYLRPLPAEERYLVGQAPSSPIAALIIDEVGFVEPDTFAVLQSALGKGVKGTRLLGVGTPGLGPVETDGQPNIMYSLRELSVSDDPPDTLRYVEHSAPLDADPGDPVTWRKANPGLGKLITENAVKNDWLTLPLDRFRLYRLGQWTQHEDSFVSAVDYDALDHAPGLPPPGSMVTLGFDGSSSSDSTAVVMMDVASRRLHVLGHWTPPKRQRGWRVPRQEVNDVVEHAFGRWNVAAMRCDPWLYRSEIQVWQDLFGADVVQELDTSRMSLMGPASDAFRASVEHGTLATDGSDQLRSHVLSAVAKPTAGGDLLTKDARKPARIDLCIAAVLAHEGARVMEEPPAVFAV